MSIEAMKQALEALECIPASGSMLGVVAEQKRVEAITVLRQTLEQRNKSMFELNKMLPAKEFIGELWVKASDYQKAITSLRQAIAEAEKQEPVALKKGECWPEEVMRQWDYWRKEIANGHKGSAPRDWFEGLSELKLIDTTPQRRKWVGLTDDELYVKASAYANNRKKAYQEGMKAGRCPKKTDEELGWIWVAHVDGYREAYWMATDDTRYTTDPYKENT